MIDRIENAGMLIDECHLPGETRADRITPAHGNGLQLSRDRFILFNATLAYRSVDNSKSTTYQLRADHWDGPVLAEGFFVKGLERGEWDPFNTGDAWCKETGAPIGWGVPKGALIRGKRVEHENRFVVKWRVCGRLYNKEEDYIVWWAADRRDVRATHRVGWAQFRLNDAEDDIEILETKEKLHQVGYDADGPFCEHPIVSHNQSFAAIWPLNEDHTQWIDINHSNWYDWDVLGQTDHQRPGSRLFPLMYEYNPRRGLYEWTRCGAIMGEGQYEASIVPYRGDWIVAGRRQGQVGLAYARLHDPLGESPQWVFPDDVKSTNTPLCAFACPDGAVRVITGDGSRHPHAQSPPGWRDNRNPLFCFDIDPQRNFRMTDCHTVADLIAQGVPIAYEHGPVADMGKLLPHTGGTVQHLLYRVRSCALDSWEPNLSKYGNQRQHKLTEGDFAASGIYHAKIHYRDPQPAMWQFT